MSSKVDPLPLDHNPFGFQIRFLPAIAGAIQWERDAPPGGDHPMPGQFLLLIAVPERESHKACASPKPRRLGNLSVGGNLAGGNAPNNLVHPLFSARHVRVPAVFHRVFCWLRRNPRRGAGVQHMLRPGRVIDATLRTFGSRPDPESGVDNRN